MIRYIFCKFLGFFSKLSPLHRRAFQGMISDGLSGKTYGHFYIDINIAAIVVLVSCYRTKEAQGGDAEGVLQFFGMRCDEGYVFFSCLHS